MRPDIDYKHAPFVRKQKESRVIGVDLLDSLCNCKTVLRDRLTENEGGLADIQLSKLLLSKIDDSTGAQSKDTRCLCISFSILSDKTMRPWR